jgi:hypothetical protein
MGPRTRPSTAPTQVAPVEVRPAAPALHPPLARHSPPSNRPMDQPARFALVGAGDRRGHRGAPPRRTPSLVAVRHDPTVVALHRTTTQCRVHEPICRSWLYRRREAPSCILPPSGAHERSSRQLGCPAMPSMLRRAPGCAPPCTRRTRSFVPRSLLGRALQFCHPVSVWQAEDAVANLPLRLAVRVHCRHQACDPRGAPRVLLGYSRRTLGGMPPPGYTHVRVRSEECSTAAGRALVPSCSSA